MLDNDDSHQSAEKEKGKFNFTSYEFDEEHKTSSLRSRQP